MRLYKFEVYLATNSDVQSKSFLLFHSEGYWEIWKIPLFFFLLIRFAQRLAKFTIQRRYFIFIFLVYSFCWKVEMYFEIQTKFTFICANAFHMLMAYATFRGSLFFITAEFLTTVSFKFYILIKQYQTDLLFFLPIASW